MRCLGALVSMTMLLACGGETDPPAGDGSSGAEDGSGTTASGPGTAGTTEPADGGSTGEASTGGSTTTGDEPPPAMPSPGCGADPGALPTSLDIQGTERPFIVALPDDYDPEQPYPLVFAWHALGTSGAIARTYYRIEEESAGAAIIVYPNGLPVASLGNQTGWNLDPAGYDIELFDALYTELTEGLCVDTGRVFSTGHSYGGFMSNLVGCVRSDRFRAIAPVAGGGPLVSCSGTVAAWIAHGTVDGTVPFALGQGTHSHWVESNGCDAATSPVDPSPCEAHTGCQGDNPVVWCAHDEPEPLGGHHWPDWAGPAIWAFFASF